MKRFMLFMYDGSPRGGMWDFSKDFDTLEEATPRYGRPAGVPIGVGVEAFLHDDADIPHGWEHFHIYDNELRGVVRIGKVIEVAERKERIEDV